MENKNIKEIFNSYNILLEMLEDRKIKIEEKNRYDINVFSKLIDDNINIIFNDELILYILKGDKITKKELLKIIENNKYGHIIILTFDKQLLNYTNEFSEKFKINLEIFQVSKLQINISKHDIVPKHILLTAEEKKEFLEDRGIKEHELPKILKNSDPMCSYFNGQIGDIFKIIRNDMNNYNRTSGQSIYYRIVS